MRQGISYMTLIAQNIYKTGYRQNRVCAREDIGNTEYMKGKIQIEQDVTKTSHKYNRVYMRRGINITG